ncbi:MAG: cytochrome c3 family protein, partial [Anaerolineae bacterium]|nr:cytochrome c3 family protein [Anaerolineae bacterium]
GYEYDGKTYDARFAHVEPFDTCIECHNPHTLEVQFDECIACHEGLESAEDLTGIRTLASLVDYDGDGDLQEGVFFEIETLQEMLMTAMQAYSAEVAGSPIVYESHTHPYFFNDTDGSGVAEEAEAERANQYASWTPRLLKAAYNYQVSQKDPGRYAHGGKYIIQLLYDSIEDLNTALAEPVDLSNARRIDHGHFAGSEEAFRHWDEEGFVPASCSKCHSADGLPTLVAEGVETSQEISNGFQCTTCHSSLETFERYVFETVEFPSGAVLGFEEPDANLCLNCHQGRAFGGSVDRAVGQLGDDEQPEQPLRFINVHYFAAGATLFGSEAHGLYQFEGQDYAGRFEHVGAFDTCIECHNAHALEVEVEACGNCHEGVDSQEDLHAIRADEDEPVDYDGDGDVEEGIAGEIETMSDLVYAALLAYTADTVGTPIVYNAHRYPYFFIDANGDGVADEGDTEGYNAFTPRSLRAAYNFQYVQKDPGAFAHNSDYVLQVLYDTLVHLGADVSGLTRPVTAAPEG